MNTALEPVRSFGEHLVAIACRGLVLARLDTGGFAQTVRGVASPTGPKLRAEGTNLRYAAIAALGISQLPDERQRAILAGRLAADLARWCAERAGTDTDPGAVALTAWAAAETLREHDAQLFSRLTAWHGSGDPLPTVDLAWMLTAAVAAAELGDTDELAAAAADRLLEAQGPAGSFPHAIPADGLGRFRAHVGSFADQIYPVQALARFAAAGGPSPALAAADRTAELLCRAQGEAGQWWWHYDARDGSVVERYPVYSVHQHAMAPMTLLDLHAAGGRDHRDSLAKGLRWLQHHPESFDDLVDERYGVIWRKVGRLEPPKAARRLNAVTTSLRPGLRAPGLDRALPPGPVDRECRPYELGWLLYAWCRPGAADAIAAADPQVDSQDATAGGSGS